MDIHARTKIRYDYCKLAPWCMYVDARHIATAGKLTSVSPISNSIIAYIESAAVRIGDDVIEISSFGDYFLNGVLRADLEEADLAGYKIKYEQPEEKKTSFEIELGGGHVLSITTFKDIVSIRFKDSEEADGQLLYEWFSTSSGMIGSLTHTGLLGRDGVTDFKDVNAFGQEWQCRERYGAIL